MESNKYLCYRQDVSQKVSQRLGHPAKTTPNSFYPRGALKHPYSSLSVLIRYYPPLSATIRHFGDSRPVSIKKLKILSKAVTILNIVLEVLENL